MMIELQYIIETSKIINRLKESFEQKEKFKNEQWTGDTKTNHIENLKKAKEDNSRTGRNPQI